MQEEANEFYWKSVMSSVGSSDNSRRALGQNQTTYTVLSGSIPNVGIAIDLVQDPLSKEAFLSLLRAIESLGMTVIQMNLANDLGHAVEYDSIPNVGYRPASLDRKRSDEKSDFPYFDRHRLEEMVEVARKIGIQLIPEINLVTTGGGWYKTGILMNCPQIVCDNGQGIAFDVVDKIDRVIPIVLAAILELWNIFSLSSVDQLLHLGSDEREKVILGCFAEAGHDSSEAHSSLHNFERKLMEALSIAGIHSSKIIRWHNGEKIDYPDRTGNITHYTDIGDIREKSENGSTPAPYFGMVLLRDEMTLWDVYQESRRWIEHPPGLRAIIAKTVHGGIPRFDHLVAFTMGFGFVSESEKDFQKEFELVCTRLECTKTTRPFYKTTAGIRSTIQETTLKETCAERTINATQRKSRALLVPDGSYRVN